MTLPGTRGSNSFFISNAGEARSDSGSELELIEIRHRVEKGGGQAPRTASHPSGFLISVGASPRFSTGCLSFRSAVEDDIPFRSEFSDIG